MPDSLEKEFEWYLDNQEEVVEKYNGKFIVIKNLSVIGAFDVTCFPIPGIPVSAIPALNHFKPWARNKQKIYQDPYSNHFKCMRPTLNVL